MSGTSALPEYPFKIPPSLNTFVEQFEADPQKSTDRLEAHLKKRGLDAAGYFVLACLYHKQGIDVLARENAQKAKNYAPGSPLFENLHYYLLHPESFNASIPRQPKNSDESFQKNDYADFDLNLDSLISKLSAADSLKVELPPDEAAGDKDLSIPAQMVSDLASETLALIYEKQGKFKQAIEALKTMQKVKPKMNDKYQTDIDRLKKLLEDEKKEKEE